MRLLQYLLTTLMIVLACSPTPAVDTPPLAVDVDTADGPVRSFAFTTLDGKLASAKGYQGRMTVVALGATYDMASHAQARFLNAVYARHKPRINALLLVLEPPENRIMVESFAAGLDLRYDVVMGDSDAIAGRRPFPGLNRVPTIVLLDRDGRQVATKTGLLDEEALHALIAEYE